MDSEMNQVKFVQQEEFIQGVVRELEHAFIYGVPPSTTPPLPRASCCQLGSSIEWCGPVADGIGGWCLSGGYDDSCAAFAMQFCPWCGQRLPDQP